MKNIKQTSKEISTIASGILKDSTSSKIQKKLAGSALSQTKPQKQTGKKLESLASHVLKSKKYSELTQALAASVLSQSNKER